MSRNRTAGYSNITKSIIGWMVVMVLVVISFLGWITMRPVFNKFDDFYNKTAAPMLNGTQAIAASASARNMANGQSNVFLYGISIVLIVVGLLYAQSRERYTGAYP